MAIRKEVLESKVLNLRKLFTLENMLFNVSCIKAFSEFHLYLTTERNGAHVLYGSVNDRILFELKKEDICELCSKVAEQISLLRSELSVLIERFDQLSFISENITKYTVESKESKTDPSSSPNTKTERKDNTKVRPIVFKSSDEEYKKYTEREDRLKNSDNETKKEIERNNIGSDLLTTIEKLFEVSQKKTEFESTAKKAEKASREWQKNSRDPIEFNSKTIGESKKEKKKEHYTKEKMIKDIIEAFINAVDEVFTQK